jgi:ABC-type uncharacterized transport system permease subunit
MAVGMTLVYGVTKAFNFAYGDFFNMGGYFAWILIFGLGLQFGGYLTILVIVMPLMFAVGYGLEKLMVAPLRKRKDWENKVMMLTLGLALFLTSLYTVVFGVTMKSLPPILEGTLEVGQLVFAYQDIMIFVMSIGGILLFGWMLNNTRTGMAVQAVAQNPEGAKIVGIPQGRIFASTFAISTVMVGFGGILLSQKWFINPMHYDQGLGGNGIRRHGFHPRRSLCRLHYRHAGSACGLAVRHELRYYCAFYSFVGDPGTAAPGSDGKRRVRYAFKTYDGDNRRLLWHHGNLAHLCGRH